MKTVLIGCGVVVLVGLYVAHRWVTGIYQATTPEDYNPKTGKYDR